jgi:putative phage-type endonuclease
MLHGLEPVSGPASLTPEWYEARYECIGASEGAAACGLSLKRAATDVYAEKRRLVEPFEGNEYTERGKRGEPFIMAEYFALTGAEVEVGLPMFFHPLYPFIGATPDGRRKSNRRHLVEAKVCHWTQAAKLGEEETDQIFPEWVCQAQQQMAVMDAEVCDVMAMLDIHTYRLFTVERNETLIERLIVAESVLWDRIERGDPPPPDFSHPEAYESVKKLFGLSGRTVQLDQETADLWRRVQICGDAIKKLEADRDALKAKVLYAIGDASIGRLPLGQKEISRCVVADSKWTETDVDLARASVGKVKRKGYVKLIERKVKD